MYILLESHYKNEWVKIEAQNVSSDKWIATYPDTDGSPLRTSTYNNRYDAIWHGKAEAVLIHCKPGTVPRFKWGSPEDRDLKLWEETLAESISSLPTVPFNAKWIIDKIRGGVALVNMRPYSLENDIWCYDVHWTDGTHYDGGYYPEGIEAIDKALGDPVRIAHHDKGARVVIVILPDEVSATQSSEWWEDGSNQ